LLIEKGDIAEVIAEADNGEVLLKLLEKVQPDLVLMDIEMPKLNGLEATQRAMELYPDLKILVLSMFGNEYYYNYLIHAGAKGFILKTSSKQELETAIKEVISGGSYFSTDLLRNIIANIGKPKLLRNPNTGLDINLSNREVEVLKYICNGLSTNEIANKIFLSAKTIEAHRAKLLLKTGVKNTVSLVMFAIKNKIIEI
jgi:DNA-binding NarL/FixJ family response regulator